VWTPRPVVVPDLPPTLSADAQLALIGFVELLQCRRDDSPALYSHRFAARWNAADRDTIGRGIRELTEAGVWTFEERPSGYGRPARAYSLSTTKRQHDKGDPHHALDAGIHEAVTT
jgi:hypothetical protein